MFKKKEILLKAVLCLQGSAEQISFCNNENVHKWILKCSSISYTWLFSTPKMTSENKKLNF